MRIGVPHTGALSIETVAAVYVARVAGNRKTKPRAAGCELNPDILPTCDSITGEAVGTVRCR